jgi:hypothetical protein
VNNVPSILSPREGFLRNVSTDDRKSPERVP